MESDHLPPEANFTYEELAKRAQHFLAERPVVVLGTGATIPHGLPSMAALADALLATVVDDLPGWDEFAQHLDETKDLEQTLHDVPLPSETVEVLVKATWEVVSACDIKFYENLLTGTGALPLAEMFRYLLRTADARIHVVTTNYDR